MTPESARKFVMQMGRYKGKPLAFLPVNYLAWIVREHSNGTLREAARAVLKYLNSLRNQTHPELFPNQATRSPAQQGPSDELRELLESTPDGLF